MLGMLLVALENFQAGLEQALELGIAGRRNERAFERAIHRLVVGDFVRDVSLVKGGAVKLRELVPLGRCLFGSGNGSCRCLRA
jgi:hypothetical protein